MIMRSENQVILGDRTNHRYYCVNEDHVNLYIRIAYRTYLISIDQYIVFFYYSNTLMSSFPSLHSLVWRACYYMKR